jgi:hypothetical protein
MSKGIGKMFSISNHQGNANQNHNLLSLTTVSMAISKRQMVMLTKMWRSGNFCMLLVGK